VELQILRDARWAPRLFHWYGIGSPSMIKAWMAERRIVVPSDLRLFWEQTGGGDFFEVESLLGPCEVPSWGDRLDDSAIVLYEQGLSKSYLPIHVGTTVTAIDPYGLAYVSFDINDFVIQRRFVSFDDWYIQAVRPLHESVYGLPTIKPSSCP
jgi:hypothetical protein